MQLGNHVVIPIPRNELGARIATHPQTGMPIGYIHIGPVRVRRQPKIGAFEVPFFYRYEATTIKTDFLMKWMEEYVGIKGRVVGRTLYLDDPDILKLPLVWHQRRLKSV
jgi:hypothetical protein